MASKGLQSFSRSLKALRSGISRVNDPLLQCLTPGLSRSMATEATLPTSTPSYSPPTSNLITNLEDFSSELPPSEVQTIIYSFPNLEPLRFHHYSAKELFLPLRRDILHRAVVYEGDNTRSGTASTKTRWEIHGSHRKIRPQKGSGRARLGTRQSPMLKGGAKSFGPRPRDFGTDLPRKIYDLAWRTALSYRYRKGELIVWEGQPDEWTSKRPEWADMVFEYNRLGRADGRSLVITHEHRPWLYKAMEGASKQGRVMLCEDVDVKDLLELGTVVIEKRSLDKILKQHSSDLNRAMPKA